MSGSVQWPEVTAAWGSDRFAERLKQALESLPPGSLPLGRTGPSGGVVDDVGLVVTVGRCEWRNGEIHAAVGVFFREAVGGCSCGDDPLILEAFAPVQVWLDAASGSARFGSLGSD